MAVTSVTDDNGVAVVTATMTFNTSPNVDWIDVARPFYLTLRSGTMGQVLPLADWGLSSVQAVAFPYLVDLTGDQPINEAYAYIFNIYFPEKTFEEFDSTMAGQATGLLRFLPGVSSINVWKHHMITADGPAGVIATIQLASYSQSQMQGLQLLIPSEQTTLWNTNFWGNSVLLPGDLVGTMGQGSANAWTADLTAAKSVPPLDQPTTAAFNMEIDGVELKWTLAVKDVDQMTMAHLHYGNFETNGPPIVGIVPPATSAQLSGTLPMLADPPSGNVEFSGAFDATWLGGPLAQTSLGDLIQAIDNNNVYVNVHTVAFPAGVARGQITTVTGAGK